MVTHAKALFLSYAQFVVEIRDNHPVVLQIEDIRNESHGIIAESLVGIVESHGHIFDYRPDIVLLRGFRYKITIGAQTYTVTCNSPFEVEIRSERKGHSARKLGVYYVHELRSYVREYEKIKSDIDEICATIKFMGLEVGK